MTANPADLSNLHDIVLPPAVSFWPPAPGWWIVGATLLAVALILLAKALARYRRNAYRREALRELDAIGPARTPVAAQRISAVLKRAALTAFPRSDVARLSGASWLAFLDQTGRTDAFTKGPAQMLPALALGAAPNADGEPILQEARHWVRRHRAAAENEPC
ncbi:MAG TPA: DUF4381 domain-containing protein [Stellaceae bacterium]|jgi:hypothetical protein|nr:DUF4381 domain-containing protein [Stellaceae bacterium]